MPSLRGASAVSFDVWGTLLDLRRVYEEVARRLAVTLNVTPSEALLRLRSAARAARAARRRMERVDVAELQRIVAETLGISVDALRGAIDAAFSSLGDVSIPGAREAVAETRGIVGRVGVLSNVLLWPSSYTRRALEVSGLAPLLDAQIYADEVGAAKPDPRAFEAAAEALGVKLDSLIHVGDRVDEDFGGALAAGASAVLISRYVSKPTLIHSRAAAVPSVTSTPEVIAAILGGSSVSH